MDGGVPSLSWWYSLLIHTDASLSDDVAGIGYTIRVEGETHEDATYVKGDYTSMDAEYLALKTAAEVASEEFDGDRAIYIYTDCKALVEKLRDPHATGKWAERSEALQSILDREWSLNWVPRERNNVADSLAHTGRRRGVEAS